MVQTGNQFLFTGFLNKPTADKIFLALEPPSKKEKNLTIPVDYAENCRQEVEQKTFGHEILFLNKTFELSFILFYSYNFRKNRILVINFKSMRDPHLHVNKKSELHYYERSKLTVPVH